MIASLFLVVRPGAPFVASSIPHESIRIRPSMRTIVDLAPVVPSKLWWVILQVWCAEPTMRTKWWNSFVGPQLLAAEILRVLQPSPPWGKTLKRRGGAWHGRHPVWVGLCDAGCTQWSGHLRPMPRPVALSRLYFWASEMNLPTFGE